MVPPTYEVGAAHYNLDAASAQFFRTPTFHLMWLKGELFGRFGRRGSLRGVMYGGMLQATWLSGARSGWITARFDPAFTALAGHYGLGQDREAPLAAWSGEATGETTQSP